MEFVYLLVGLVVGVLLGWLLGKAGVQSVREEQRTAVQALESERSALAERARQLEQQLQEGRSRQEQDRQQQLELNGKLSEAVTLNRNLQEKLQSQKAELEALQDRFTKEFENLANRILEEKSQKFVEQNRNNLDVILNPLKEKIRDFEQKVDQAYKSEAAERNSLKGEIGKLVELNKQISDEAHNLARALKGDTKKQGNWGEFILEKILEHSGLERDREFKVQHSTSNEEGRRVQPDVVVFLPDNKHLIVDSKVSLVAYEAMVNAGSEEEREQYLREHVQSVKNHVRQLSEKKYQSAEGMNAPDFVLLFMPIEPSFSVAIQGDTELFAYAWDRKIVIVSPSTLLATLRTIASLWKQERQTRNALEIARVGGALYDKFKGFIDDLIDVGKKMDAAKAGYSDAMNKLSSGPGNIIKRIEDLRKLGAKSSKELPQALVERALESGDTDAAP
ncbi:MAG: DNA recombination protein RmuC [Bacteroidota bacterium]|jgi:DNA recombination protein RmuC|uniref:DNA recombination protein RmuC n=1 Tax=Candidatus Pollutiaquabacter sp. TaxID=3416354 RepID=UPI001A5F0B93|nr:DNA recombination protein RmuC [Bacteroidota bacterium]MBL7949419.1 DNA recombination protein RmuC [Bacteroidia bacterium]HPD52799.1 DNA recombination protein RmuC [Bacteroidia bacterium]HRS38789.1 DNA recombination protein RmuC [Bacteroidia bacterium]HRU61526.1 DNA recombination protein RmuC [Bacteroidia bacterium]